MTERRTPEEIAREIILVLMAEPWWRGTPEWQAGFRLYLQAALRTEREQIRTRVDDMLRQIEALNL